MKEKIQKWRVTPKGLQIIQMMKNMQAMMMMKMINQKEKYYLMSSQQSVDYDISLINAVLLDITMKVYHGTLMVFEAETMTRFTCTTK